MSVVSTKPHWECNETKCMFRKISDPTLWGVVIQRLTCKGHDSASRFCFKYIRFMSDEDGNQNKHTLFHEIFWASFSKNKGWRLVRRINVTEEEMGPDTDLDKLGHPPELPPPNKIFVLPNTFKILQI